MAKCTLVPADYFGLVFCNFAPMDLRCLVAASRVCLLSPPSAPAQTCGNFGQNNAFSHYGTNKQIGRLGERLHMLLQPNSDYIPAGLDMDTCTKGKKEDQRNPVNAFGFWGPKYQLETSLRDRQKVVCRRGKWAQNVLANPLHVFSATDCYFSLGCRRKK